MPTLGARKASNHIMKSSTMQLRFSPSKWQKATSSSIVLFEDEEAEDVDGMPPLIENDEVAIEVERWKSISADTVNGFKDKETGMVNEFALMWAKRKEFPLHYFVFRQTASHLPHEGNVEQIFSLGGRPGVSLART